MNDRDKCYKTFFAHNLHFTIVDFTSKPFNPNLIFVGKLERSTFHLTRKDGLS